MIGDTSDTVWGVMDIYPLTNFPDIRRKCIIDSAAGNLIIIPREGGSLTRFYIQLPPGSQPKDVTLADLQDTARAIFAPHTMSFASTFWWSAYSIGQRLASSFAASSRVFLTGDACHTHSPKAGQGMNVSLQDGYNIGWKLASVLARLSPPALLETYVSERARTAADLIAFDKELAAMFSRKEARPGEFAEYFTQSARYTAGLTARYEASVAIAAEVGGGEGGSAASGIAVGMRFPSHQVIRFCDCRPMQLQSVLRSDGRWRVVVFAGDINEAAEKKKRLEEVRITHTLPPFPLPLHLHHHHHHHHCVTYPANTHPRSSPPPSPP
jgi:phenol 2-monooxygenase